MRLAAALLAGAAGAVRAAGPATQGDDACVTIQAAADDSADRLRALGVRDGFMLGGRRVLPAPQGLQDAETGAWPRAVPDLAAELKRHPGAAPAVVEAAGQHHLLLARDGVPEWSIWLEHPSLGCDFRRRRTEVLVQAPQAARGLCARLLRGQPVPAQRLRPATDAGVAGWFHVDFANTGQPVDVAWLEEAPGRRLALSAAGGASAATGPQATLLSALDPGLADKDGRYAFLTWAGRIYLDARDGDRHVVRTIDAGRVETACMFATRVETTPMLVERGAP